MRLKVLVGSGDRIMVATLPFVVIGVILNVAFPSFFGVGGPSEALRAISIVLLALGLVLWVWSVVLVLTKVPRGELITGGPYALMKHPIYTAVALLVLPSIGFLLDTWLGLALGVVMYVASRRYAPAEEAVLAETFGPAWERYRDTVRITWL